MLTQEEAAVKRFVKVCVGTTALALGIAITPIAAIAGSAHAANSAFASGGHGGKITALRVVNLRAISGKTAKGHPAIATVFREANPSAVAAQRAAAVRSGGRRSGVASLRSGIRAASHGQTWEDFSAMTLNEQIGAIGGDQNLQPPDTQLAAGPTALLEATNDSLSLWSKTLEPLAFADLNLFFNVPSTQSFTDPRLLYDNQTGRWIISGWSLDANNNSRTYLAVSATSDPTGNWFVYTLNSFVSGMTGVAMLTDQPMTGVCDDKIVMAWNVFTGTGTNTAFTASQTLVLQKSALIAGSSAVNYQMIGDGNESRPVPAQSLGSTTTCYETVNKADSSLPGGSSTSPTLAVIALAGTPTTQGGGGVTATEADLALASATNPPPAPAQPGAPATVEAATSNDDRLLSAVWQNGVLWTSATDACTPSGDATTRNCLRLWDVNAPVSGTPTLTSDTDLSQAGADEYYPAVGLDSAGDLFVSYTASSSAQGTGLPGFPGLYATISPVTAASGLFINPVTIAVGQTDYDGTGGGTLTARWGDYSAVAPDPTAPGAVWVAGEYAPSDANLGDWATAAGLISLSAPPAAAVAVGVEGTDGQLWVQTPQLGIGWHPLGGVIVGPPAVVAAPTPYSSTPATPLFIGTGTDKHLWIRSATAGWQPIGAALCIGGPGAVVDNGTLTVACRGTDNALWYNTVSWPGTGLPVFPASGWHSLGGVLSAAPAIAPLGGPLASATSTPANLTFFVRGSNGRIFTRTVGSGYAATPWSCLGAPAAGVETASQDTYFACQGTDHALWVTSNGGSLQNGAFGGWLPAGSLGGMLIGGPAVAAGSLVTSLLVEGTNKAVFEFTDVSGSFTSLGGVAVGGVGAAALN
jgi:hypothetical protein